MNDPIGFALAFVGAMRKRTDLSQTPSLRTTVAIPRFLTARRFRTGALTARDFVEAAVYLTPYEDQGAAFEVARAILFPKEQPAAPEVAAHVHEDAVVAAATPLAAPPVDEGSSLLADLAGMDLGDLGSLDLDALDRALDAKASEAMEMKALDVLTELARSDDPEDQSAAALANLFGGPALLESEGARDEASVMALLTERLRGRVGGLTPEEAFHAGHAGIRIVDELDLAWEKVGVLAAGGKEGIGALLEGALDEGDIHVLGKMLAFLAPHKNALGPTHGAFQKTALASARHLTDWAEMLDGMGMFVAPPDGLVAASAKENLPRALAAADALERAFSRGMKPTVFEAWANAIRSPASLDFLIDCCVPCAKWEQMMADAFTREIRDVLAHATSLETEARAERVRSVLPIGRRLRATKTALGTALAGELATLALVTIADRARFLPLLDALLDAKLMPSDNARVVQAGLTLGIDESDIWARLCAPLEQLRYLIEARVTDVERHIALVAQITFIPDAILHELVARCLADENMLGLAVLLAVALGPVAEMVPAETVDKALCYKGIGGGDNLLVQWFDHRTALHPELRERIKAIARAALIDAAFAWVHKGTGSAEKGLVPQSRARPFRAGDEVDDLDLEATLDELIASGKSLDQLNGDDLFVSDTSSGRAGFGVLIDISGSMSGKDLAVCAIAVVMLLGKLRPEEVAIALFESNTHVMKRFHEDTDLDAVADQLLELVATGGTRVDAALRFIAEEFESEREHERRLLFLLSDFEFFEREDELVPVAHRIRDLGVGYLGASHGRFSKKMSELFVRHLGGHVVTLSSMAKLPDVLLQALTVVGEGRLT